MYCENIGEDYQVLKDKEFEDLPVFISVNEASKDEKNEDLRKQKSSTLHEFGKSFIYQRKNGFKGSQIVLDYLTTDETLGYSLEIENKIDPIPSTEAN